jgi:primosomal protein N'
VSNRARAGGTKGRSASGRAGRPEPPAAPDVCVEVALPLPVHHTFTYSGPAELAARAEPGARVLVPFGKRERIGWVDRVSHPDPPSERIRPILGVLDREPSVPHRLLELARWIADYYVAPLGIVLRTALPASLCDESAEWIGLPANGPDWNGPNDSDSPLERILLQWLREHPGAQPVVAAGEHVLEYRLLGEDREVLEGAGDPQVDAPVRADAGELGVSPANAPRRRVAPGDAVQQRGLPGAVRPDHRVHGAGLHVEAHLVQRTHAAEGEGDARQSEHRCRAGSRVTAVRFG